MVFLTPEVSLLLVAALTIGVVHTAVGPDHYLPFISLARERAWSLKRTLLITLACGLVHCASSIIVGTLGLALGWALSSMEAFEAMRGSVAAWLLFGFGLAYLIYGVRQYQRSQVHSHIHTHADGTRHKHPHKSSGAHAHAHVKSSASPLVASLMVIFLLGPCEALIPMLMVPAATANLSAVLAVTIVFSVATLATMLVLVLAGTAVAERFRWQPVAGLSGMICGTVIGACGAAMLFGL